MTRFARATGSKSSNQRIPEDSTPWQIMKLELHKKQDEKKNSEKREKMNEVRQKNYNKFLEENTKIEKSWADIPEDITPIENQNKLIKKNKSEKEVIDLKNINEIKLKRDCSDVDYAPEEMSSKVEMPEVIILKRKKKHQPFLIKPVDTHDISKNQNDNNEMTNKEVKKNKKLKKSSNASKNQKEFDSVEIEGTMHSAKINQKGYHSDSKETRNNEMGQNQKIVRSENKKQDNQSEESSNLQLKMKKNRNKKVKTVDVFDKKVHNYKKLDSGAVKMMFNGIEVNVVKFEGFPVKKEDAERLKDLRKQLISKGIPKNEIQRTMQLERRKAEKALSRERKKVCFHCRKPGHMLSECPIMEKEHISTSGTGICFKCGSTEHTHFECKVMKKDDFKFASCFICKEQGHIARQCPDNPKGMYPDGGACKLCGDVTHLKKDCPTYLQDNQEKIMFLNTISAGNIDGLEGDTDQMKFVSKQKVLTKVVKF